ncbi:unnamed protein product, partial [Meganyctiphanes norvegica]
MRSVIPGLGSTRDTPGTHLIMKKLCLNSFVHCILCCISSRLSFVKRRTSEEKNMRTHLGASWDYEMITQDAPGCVLGLKGLNSNVKSTIKSMITAFESGIKSVQPKHLIGTFIQKEESSLCINGHNYPISKNVYVVGFGKAVMGMAAPLEHLLRIDGSSTHLQRGIISVPKGIQNTFSNRPELLLSENSVIEVIEGAKDNIPDDDALKATENITSLMKMLTKDDMLLVLISGGGSALLPAPKPPVSLAQKSQLIKSLSRAGVTINELNTVRKALSTVKGGKLAQMTNAPMISLILSDIINSPLDMIASGPTVLNSDPPDAAHEILKRYDVNVPEDVKAALINTSMESQRFDHVSNIIIGSNETALEAVKTNLEATGKCIPVILSSTLSGDAKTVGGYMVDLAKNIIHALKNSLDQTYIFKYLCITEDKFILLKEAITKGAKTETPLCLIFGGETTVEVQGKGRGGRNQEMVLAMSIALEKELPQLKFSGEIAFLSAGTDGIDGPTDVAGAVTFGIAKGNHLNVLTAVAHQNGLNPQSYLDNNDSYNYFKLIHEGAYHINTGHTGTNVMDLQILWINPKP